MVDPHTREFMYLPVTRQADQLGLTVEELQERRHQAAQRVFRAAARYRHAKAEAQRLVDAARDELVPEVEAAYRLGMAPALIAKCTEAPDRLKPAANGAKPLPPDRRNDEAFTSQTVRRWLGLVNGESR